MDLEEELIKELERVKLLMNKYKMISEVYEELNDISIILERDLIQLRFHKFMENKPNRTYLMLNEISEVFRMKTTTIEHAYNTAIYKMNTIARNQRVDLNYADILHNKEF
jgi:hypothetical protein